MITIIYSTHKPENYNKKFKEHLVNSVGIKQVQILEYINNDEFSLSQIYNKGISESLYDIIVCCHNDIKLETGWGKKLLKEFENNDDYGIIGKAGSFYFPESGVYWEKMNETMVGQVYHHPDGQSKWLSKYSAKLPFLIPVVTIDGLFISFNKTKIKHQFDETIGKFHFYDHSFCVPNFLDGIKIGVTSSFDITHQSIGQPNKEFYESKDEFLKKYKKKLPINLPPTNVYYPKIKRKTFKNFGKVAIVIPTKGKVQMLFDCIDSFIEQCDSSIFEIFIADTGSTDFEKNEIVSNIEKRKNNIIIHFIEFDYYNFSQINNEVVKNFIPKHFEFILFSNNDIVILNDVLSSMLSVYKSYPKAAIVGARLHFSDNTVQHDGIFLGYQQSTNRILVSHCGFRSGYNYTTIVKSIIGVTGALLLIKKEYFEKLGMFNESYIECFEDLELNIKSIVMGFENYLDGNAVAYHFESQTRNEDNGKNIKMSEDYSQRLIPYIVENQSKLKNKIQML
jgi:hypothetical protein